MDKFERLNKHLLLRILCGPLWGGQAIAARFADTQFLNANRLTEEKWPETFFEYMLENMQLSKFMGDGDDNIIQIDRNLQKGAGDKLTFRLALPLSNAGGYDDSNLEGNEEQMNFYNFQVVVHERSNAVKSAGKMTAQRTKVNIRREATTALGRWAAEQLENDLMYALSGLGNQNTYAGESTSAIQTVNEHAPSTNRVLHGGQTLAGTLTGFAATNSAITTTVANYQMGLLVISAAKRKAQMATPKFRPIMINGKGYYVLFIHPLQTKSLQNGTSAVTSWKAIQAAANVRGINNPLFTREGAGRDRLFDGALGVYDDVIIYEYQRIQTRVAGEVFETGDTLDAAITDGTYRIARALLLGAQAGCLAWAQMWKRYEKNFDYNRKPGTAIDSLYGVSKTVFNDPGASQNTNTAQDDFAVIAIDTVVVDD